MGRGPSGAEGRGERDVFVTGGSGVLGSALVPLLAARGDRVRAPSVSELDLFDPDAVRRAVRGADAVVHLATRIPPPERMGEPGAWAMNDRLRAEASRHLVDAASAAGVQVYIQPTVTFVYPPHGHVDESTPIVGDGGDFRSAVEAERQAARFTAGGGRGVALRFGLLFGPGTGSPEPDLDRYGAVLHVEDAGAALLAALDAPAGVYNVVASGGRVSNVRFMAATGWSPRHAVDMHLLQDVPVHTSS